MSARPRRRCRWPSPKPATAYPPRVRLARYIAASACRSRAAASAPCAGYTAIPMLASTYSGWPCSRQGAASARKSARAAPAAAFASSPGNRTANSSPYRRARVSASRNAPRRCAATCWSSRSPAWCPRRSLTALNRSRSRKSSATVAPSRRASTRACSRWSVNNVRLGRSVRASCSARCSSAAARCRASSVSSRSRRPASSSRSLTSRRSAVGAVSSRRSSPMVWPLLALALRSGRRAAGGGDAGRGMAGRDTCQAVPPRSGDVPGANRAAAGRSCPGRDPGVHGAHAPGGRCRSPAAVVDGGPQPPAPRATGL